MGLIHGTKLTFNFSKGIQEPDLNSQTGSLQTILGLYGYADLIAKYNVPPIGGQTSRSYDGGFEQTLVNERLLMKAIYFHNQFDNQIEFVDGGSLSLIGVSPVVAAAVEQTYGGASVNSLAFRAQGAEVELQGEISSHIFGRGGYTYTDGVVQQSFSSDAIGPQENPLFPCDWHQLAAHRGAAVSTGAARRLRGSDLHHPEVVRPDAGELREPQR